MGFVHTRDLMALLDDTPKLADLDLDAFDALMVAGGLVPVQGRVRKQVLSKWLARAFDIGP
jgi:hypothetical protein